MKKKLLLFMVLIFGFAQAQTDKYWSEYTSAKTQIKTNSGVERQSFPKAFKLFSLNVESLRQVLFASSGNGKQRGTTVITLPNAEGQLESFEMYEASNFDAELQAQFPQIRAYSGKGLTDKYATLKLSISPQGIQTMVFRTDRENEFIESYSNDNTVYAVFKSQRTKENSNWSCTTVEETIVSDLNAKVENVQKSSTGQLKTMRLAQSCNGEYSEYFAAKVGQPVSVAISLAAINNTLTRCNGVYEKDLALHLNLVASSVNVIYLDPATDPYSTTMSSWNSALQNALNTTLTGVGTTLAANNAVYDIGHMFGASGGGGNAGCIGCVCVNGVSGGGGATKGRGITSPGDGIPEGDNFDIDYVVHEIGHQLGGNHTFSMSSEGSGVNKEVGSGVTIMGYAGITSNDVAPHSIDIYHEATIAQIQSNLATKTCPITTSISANNATPVVNSVADFVIPKNTPFVLTGSATDANGDALTYCWEQNDDAGSQTGASSNASPTKTQGPNFISWSPTSSPSRYFPKLSSILANSATTSQVGGDAGMLSEALSSVARELNFRLTVRDNAPYSSVAPFTVGQTAYTDVKVTVDDTSGPFALTAPNTAVTLDEGSNQTITWDVANTNIGAVNEKFVDVFFSNDGGNTYPILLASKVPNDGSETVTIPVSATSGKVGSQNRIMVKANNNVFFDISNVNMSTIVGGNTFAVAFNGVAGSQNKSICQGASTSYEIKYDALGGFSGTTTFSASGLPAGAVATFSPTTLTSADGMVTMTITTLTSTPAGMANIIVTGTSGATTKTAPFYLDIENAVFGTPSLTTPADNAITQNTTLNLTWGAASGATLYDVEVATDNTFTNIIASGSVSSTNFALSGLSNATDYYWRVLPKNTSCGGVYGSPFKFSTGIVICSAPVSTEVPLFLSASGKPSVTSHIIIPAGSGVTINDLNITMNVDHEYVSDIRATLTGPTGAVIQLFTYQCGANINVNATFDDAGTALVCGANPAITGTIAPVQPLSIFNGTPSEGTWTLFIKDNFNGDGGQLNSWSLNICSIEEVVLSNPEFELEGISLYPNPNKGDFTVKFNSASREDIKINVHDMSGRQVYEQSFSNTGAFDQNIGLNNVQAGIYLVTIADGEKKIVKRIVVE